METIDLYRSIIAYYTKTRGIGHTKAVINGVDKTLNACIVVQNSQTAEYIERYMKERYKIYFLSSFELGTLNGIRRPLVFDNNAIQELLFMGMKEIEQLELKNNKLKFINDNFKRQSYYFRDKLNLVKEIINNKKWTSTGKLRKIKSVLNK